MSDTTSDLASRAQAREEVIATNEVAALVIDAAVAAGVERPTLTFRYDIADGILARFDYLAGLLGYVKADGVEWGYRRVPGFSVGFPYTRDAAQRLADLHPDGTLERRSVGHGPWEVVTNAES